MNHFKSKTQGSALITLLGGIVILVSVLYLLVKLATSGYFADVSDSSANAVETRIQPAGRLNLGDGTEPGQRTGKQVFDKICVQCHAADSQIAYSPKITHNDQWAPRIAKGFETLVNNATKGFTGPQGGNMPAKGGAADLTDDEVARAVAYMANQSGGNFTEPAAGGAKAASDTASGAASESAASAASAAAAPAAGGKAKEQFDQACAACHGATAAIPFAPKLTKNDEWAPRIKQGKATLYKHAIEGFTNPKGGMMPAKGGAASISDDDIKAIVDYMVSESGG